MINLLCVHTKFMKNILEKKGNSVSVKVTDTALLYCNKAIEQVPDFPFSYWAKAAILSSLKDRNYLYYAKKAFDILQITTSIPGHNPWHDTVFIYIQNFLKDKSP